MGNTKASTTSGSAGQANTANDTGAVKSSTLRSQPVQVKATELKAYTANEKSALLQMAAKLDDDLALAGLSVKIWLGRTQDGEIAVFRALVNITHCGICGNYYLVDSFCGICEGQA
jgi:hypothetical protein